MEIVLPLSMEQIWNRRFEIIGIEVEPKFNFLEEKSFSTTFAELKAREILTSKEVMYLLRISNATLHRWTEQGILDKHGIGGKVIYKFSEVMQALIKLDN
tara:strand:+ start:108 stop:407 length:300 start_codon:yes stop_codon:yes gene_type:complete